MKGYQLHISIQGSDPTVFRRVLVPQHVTFYQFHQCLQIIFGWSDIHLHLFYLPQLDCYIGMDDENCSVDEPEEECCLQDLLTQGMKIIYTYDFGDDWCHTIVVEKEVELDLLYAQVVAWEGDNFLEDSGNVEGFQELLARANDPTDPDQATLHTWFTENHICFDLDDVNHRLSLLSVPPSQLMDDVHSTLLETAVLQVRSQLWEESFDDLFLIIIEDQEEKIYISCSREEDDITIQIYDNEQLYLQEVEYNLKDTPSYVFFQTTCIILNDLPLPLGGWKSTDQKNMAKKIIPCYSPQELDNQDAKRTIMRLSKVFEVLTSWTSAIPTYESNECLHATKVKDTWQTKKEAIRFHHQKSDLHLPTALLQILSQKEQTINELKLDIISIPPEQPNETGELDILLVMEGSQKEVFPVPIELFDHMDHIDHFVVETLGYFIELHGLPKRILVNHEILRIMLSPTCKDLHIALQLRPFITELENSFIGVDEDDDDLHILNRIAQMSEEEFYDFMERMDEEDLEEFQSFLDQYMEMDEYEDLFKKGSQKINTQKFDA